MNMFINATKNNFLDKKTKKGFKIIYDDKGISFYGTPPPPFHRSFHCMDVKE